jgi:hypothetical protein
MIIKDTTYNNIRKDRGIKRALILLWEIISWDTGHWGRLAGSSLMCPKAEPQEQRGLTLYTLVSRLQKQKSKAQPTCGCMWLHWLSYFPSATWPSCFNSLSVIRLLCYPFPLSPQNTACLFLFWPSSLLNISELLECIRSRVKCFACCLI